MINWNWVKAIALATTPFVLLVAIITLCMIYPNLATWIAVGFLAVFIVGAIGTMAADAKEFFDERSGNR